MKTLVQQIATIISPKCFRTVYTGVEKYELRRMFALETAQVILDHLQRRSIIQVSVDDKDRQDDPDN